MASLKTNDNEEIAELKERVKALEDKVVLLQDAAESNLVTLQHILDISKKKVDLEAQAYNLQEYLLIKEKEKIELETQANFWKDEIARLQALSTANESENELLKTELREEKERMSQRELEKNQLRSEILALRSQLENQGVILDELPFEVQEDHDNAQGDVRFNFEDNFE